MTFPLNLNVPPRPVERGHLDLGGTGPAGTIAVNSYYIERDGKPFFPIVGEFHYSRYPAADWEAELHKMKSGGLNVVATYVFWNMHERHEGAFDWAGDLGLRRFTQLVARVDLTMILRVGPFDHGEIRNGGFPDWLYGRAFEVRSNDPQYLDYAGKLYAQIGQQVRGLFHKDGGPIIGVQIENEYQHSAAPWEFRYPGSPRELTVAESDAGVTHVQISAVTNENENAGVGRDHMTTLKRLAKQHGLDAPLYTATGWGNAAIVPLGSLPVNAAYSYPYWANEPAPSPFYLFKDLHRAPDYPPASYEAERYPALPAELGVGMSVVYDRRAYVPEASVEPMMIRMLGSGANGLGYYMYHGGATPQLDGLFYHEEASGLPKINYDYQAPIGQYGQTREHYRTLRLVHLFLASYGDRLAPCPPILPPNHGETSADKPQVLRYAARAANGSGFVFLLNFQDHVAPVDVPDVRLAIDDGGRTIAVPNTGTLTLKSGVAAVLPINLDLDGARLRSATVQPLCILPNADGKRHHVFFAIDGVEPELVFDAGAVTDAEHCRIEAGEGGATIVRGTADRCFSFTIDGTPVLVVPRAMALQATPIDGGRLAFAGATLTSSGSTITLTSAGKSSVDVVVYPSSAEVPHVAGAQVESIAAPVRGMSAYRVVFEPVNYAATFRKVTSSRYALKCEADLGSLNDLFVHFDFVGDTGKAFIDGRMVDDHFYFGRPWQIGLKRFMPDLAGKEIVFVFHPMERDAAYLKFVPEAFHPTFAEGQKHVLEIGGPTFIPEYKATIELP